MIDYPPVPGRELSSGFSPVIFLRSPTGMVNLPNKYFN